jgi:hypothetical protein
MMEKRGGEVGSWLCWRELRSFGNWLEEISDTEDLGLLSSWNSCHAECLTTWLTMTFLQ